MSVVEQLCEAMAPFVARHSAVLRIKTNADGLDVGTATCVGVGQDFFLATARHNVADLPTKTRVQVAASEGTFAPSEFLAVQRFCVSEDSADDVAWIQLDPDGAETLGLTALPLDQLGPGVPFVSGNLYLAAGVQAATKKFSKGEGESTVVDLKFRACLSEPFEPESNEDLRLRYAGKVVRSDGSISEHDPPNGMSGGGLWSVTQEQWSSIWVPDRCRLLGIVGSYNAAGFLRCTPIRNWLRLLYRTVPGAAVEIDKVRRRFEETDRDGPPNQIA